MDRNNKRPLLPNLVVGALIVVALVVSVAALVLKPPADSQAFVVIHGPDGYERTVSLAKDDRVTVSTQLGRNVVVVEDGAAHMEDADCPNQDCLRQQAISAPGQQIICLPHQVWLEVVPAGGESGEMDVNAVTTNGDADRGAEPADLVAR